MAQRLAAHFTRHEPSIVLGALLSLFRRTIGRIELSNAHGDMLLQARLITIGLGVNVHSWTFTDN